MKVRAFGGGIVDLPPHVAAELGLKPVDMVEEEKRVAENAAISREAHKTEDPRDAFRVKK